MEASACRTDNDCRQIRFGKYAAGSRLLEGLLPLQRDREGPTITVRVDVAHIEAINRYFVKPDTVGSTRQAERLGHKTRDGVRAHILGHNNGGDR
jgi:hypothetical protein